MRRPRAAGLTLAAWSLAPFALSSVLFVDVSAPGPAHDGTSWATAYTNLQDALLAAGSGDEIWVAAGTYRPAAADRTASFALKNGVGVYGGFDGTESQRSQRDPAIHLTTLSGDVGTAGVAADNSYHVVTSAAGVTASAVLDGFRITGGQADGAAPANRGAGIYVAGGSPMLSNLVIGANAAAERGGGARVDAGSPSFSSCVFESNSAGGGTGFGGGGLSAGGVGTLAVDRCVFRGNSVSFSSSAGAIHTSNNTIVTDSLIVGNSPNAIVFAGQGNKLVHCTITGNSGYGVTFIDVNNTVANSILRGNSLGQINPFFNDAAVTYTDIAGGHAGAGNIDLDPLFENGAGGDYRLRAGSPAVDAGNNAAAAGLSADLAGLPRFFDDPAAPDTGSGTPPLADMGAHERIPLTVSAPVGAESLCLAFGTTIHFTVTATGQVPLSYRWRRGSNPLSDDTRISGASTDSLTVDSPVAGDAGIYDVVVTDSFGQRKTSPPATLTLHAVPAAPTLALPRSVPAGGTGLVASVPAHTGSSYIWTLTNATIKTGDGTSQITYDAGEPGRIATFRVEEVGPGNCVSESTSVATFVDFLDVPPSYLFHDAIVSMFFSGITTGCGAGKYCPSDPVTRDAMAVFILRGEHGGGAYVPPDAAGGVFSDVAPSTFLAKWIEQFGNEGISTGCAVGSPPPYCPTQPVTRDGMAVFLLRGKHGAAFNPPAATGAVFCDVGAATFLAKWMEDLKTEAITSGCGAGVCGKPNYCPQNTVTRGEMAAFIKKTFGLP